MTKTDRFKSLWAYMAETEGSLQTTKKDSDKKPNRLTVWSQVSTNPKTRAKVLKKFKIRPWFLIKKGYLITRF